MKRLLKILPSPYCYMGINADDKVYDGTTAATISGATLVGMVGSDDVTLGNATSGTFAQDIVGTDISVTTAPMTISGADAGNYSLTQPSLDVDITAKPITGNFNSSKQILRWQH